MSVAVGSSQLLPRYGDVAVGGAELTEEEKERERRVDEIFKEAAKAGQIEYIGFAGLPPCVREHGVKVISGAADNREFLRGVQRQKLSRVHAIRRLRETVSKICPIARIRSFARAPRRTQRPAVAVASGGGDDDSGGDSSSGDLPRSNNHSAHFNFPTEQNQISNISRRSSGCCHMAFSGGVVR